MNEPSRILLAAVVAPSFLGAIFQQRPEQSASDTDFRIGNLMPYTGALD
jgi:branched-chain amino acid transport system substrate-binding protein